MFKESVQLGWMHDAIQVSSTCGLTLIDISSASTHRILSVYTRCKHVCRIWQRDAVIPCSMLIHSAFASLTAHQTYDSDWDATEVERFFCQLALSVRPLPLHPRPVKINAPSQSFYIYGFSRCYSKFNLTQAIVSSFRHWLCFNSPYFSIKKPN